LRWLISATTCMWLTVSRIYRSCPLQIQRFSVSIFSRSSTTLLRRMSVSVVFTIGIVTSYRIKINLSVFNQSIDQSINQSVSQSIISFHELAHVYFILFYYFILLRPPMRLCFWLSVFVCLSDCSRDNVVDEFW